jgi:DDE superfamily endonuclease
MATDLLIEKGGTEHLGVNWHLHFLNRHPDLKSKFVPPLDRNRCQAQDHEIFEHWFKLFLDQKARFEVLDNDIWNIDEKGVMMGVSGKTRVIIPKSSKNPHTTHPGNREWVTSTECISMAGKKLGSWTIFKGKKPQKMWHETMKRIGEFDSGYHIACSENGWTDNELGLEYLKEHFEPQTRTQTDRYRILICDGHESHVSTAAIKFCLDHKIILLCLPPHSTHLLQPLDVGIFGPISTKYKNAIRNRFEFNTESYNIDKVDFLEIWHEVRRSTITPENVKSAWRDSGLLPYNPDVVLSQLPPKPESLYLGLQLLMDLRHLILGRRQLISLMLS